jgi:hypothetical protein
VGRAIACRCGGAPACRAAGHANRACISAGARTRAQDDIRFVPHPRPTRGAAWGIIGGTMEHPAVAD